MEDGYLDGCTLSTFTCTHRLTKERGYNSQFSTSVRILRSYCSDWCHRNQKTRGKSTEMRLLVFSKHMHALVKAVTQPPDTTCLLYRSPVLLFSFLSCVCYCQFVFQLHIQGAAQGATSGVRQTSEKNTFMITVSAWLSKHSFSFFPDRKTKQNRTKFFCGPFQQFYFSIICV